MLAPAATAMHSLFRLAAALFFVLCFVSHTVHATCSPECPQRDGSNYTITQSGAASLNGTLFCRCDRGFAVPRRWLTRHVQLSALEERERGRLLLHVQQGKWTYTKRCADAYRVRRRRVGS